MVVLIVKWTIALAAISSALCTSAQDEAEAEADEGASPVEEWQEPYHPAPIEPPAFCGGLPMSALNKMEPLPPNNWKKAGLVDEGICAEWSPLYSCCSPAEAIDAVGVMQANVGNGTTQSSAALADGERKGHCFVGYEWPNKGCDRTADWASCAVVCDAYFPRDLVSGLPKENICYERFTARQGLDTIRFPGPTTACERAASLTEADLGSCDAVYVIGGAAANDFAIAVGGRAICMSGALRNAPALLLVVGFAALALLR